MTAEYRSPGLKPIAFDFDNVSPVGPDAELSLSHKDVLGIVHAAFDALGPQDARLIAARQSVLEEVAAGRLAHALRAAIIGAGRGEG